MLFRAGVTAVLGRACIAPERRDALRMTDGAVIRRARRAGFVIMQGELPNGALVWTWRGGNDSAGPGFTTRREAFAWMSDWLTHNASFGRSDSR